MNLKSTLVLSAALLFATAPAWGDSVKSKTPDLATSSRTSSFSRSDMKRLGGFKTQDGRLLQMSGDDVVPDGDADDSTVSAPEPGSLALLFTGLLCVGAFGAFAYRRNHSAATA
jgi:hypothetical protein